MYLYTSEPTKQQQSKHHSNHTSTPNPSNPTYKQKLTTSQLSPTKKQRQPLHTPKQHLHLHPQNKLGNEHQINRHHPTFHTLVRGPINRRPPSPRQGRHRPHHHHRRQATTSTITSQTTTHRRPTRPRRRHTRRQATNLTSTFRNLRPRLSPSQNNRRQPRRNTKRRTRIRTPVKGKRRRHRRHINQ